MIDGLIYCYKWIAHFNPVDFTRQRNREVVLVGFGISSFTFVSKTFYFFRFFITNQHILAIYKFLNDFYKRACDKIVLNLEYQRCLYVNYYGIIYIQTQ